GVSALGNNPYGIYLENAPSNTIGSFVAGAGNLISGNLLNGITLTNNANWNVIQGNLIGIRNDGITELGNTFFAIEINGICSNNVVGGSLPGAGNRIAFSGATLSGGRAGVRVRTGAVNTAILGNSIFSNYSLGIAFSGFSPTSNDNCDAD